MNRLLFLIIINFSFHSFSQQVGSYDIPCGKFRGYYTCEDNHFFYDVDKAKFYLSVTEDYISVIPINEDPLEYHYKIHKSDKLSWESLDLKPLVIMFGGEDDILYSYKIRCEENNKDTLGDDQIEFVRDFENHLFESFLYWRVNGMFVEINKLTGSPCSTSTFCHRLPDRA